MELKRFRIGVLIELTIRNRLAFYYRKSSVAQLFQIGEQLALKCFGVRAFKQ